MSFFKTFTDVVDTVSVLASCSSDRTILLVEDSNQEFYFPTNKFVGFKTWPDCATRDVEDIFEVVDLTNVIRIIKVWLPKPPFSYYLHVIYQFDVPSEIKGKSRSAVGKYKGKIKWVNEGEIKKMFSENALKSPEVFELFYLSLGLKSADIYVPPDPVNESDCLYEITENVLVDSKITQYESLVTGAEYTRAIQETIYREFLTQTLPCVIMGFSAFYKIVTYFGWSADETLALFRAANLNNRNGLSFRELLYFLAATDSKANPIGPMNEVRNIYVFSFFDRDTDGFLNFNELKNLISATRKARKLPIDATSTVNEVSETYKMLGIADGKPLSLNEFNKAVKESKIRGVAQVLKSQVTILQFVNEKSKTHGVASEKTHAMSLSIEKTEPAKTNISAYELAIHTVKIEATTNQINVQQIFDVADTVSLTTLKRLQGIEVNKKPSLEKFSLKSVTNDLLKSIRYLIPLNKKILDVLKNQKVTYMWGQLDVGVFVKNMVNICNMVALIFKNEDRLLKIKSPVYTMGDIHGNISDLLLFEKTLWPLGPNLCPCDLVFLGDYVDRGAFSIEVIGYLFCYKIQTPHKLKMIRGNHEIRDVQKMFTFYSECILKCGERLGTELWSAINKAFDYMPVAGVIDDAIFCCHGGCPPPWLCPVIAAIDDIPSPLMQPNIQSLLAWEIMWNDPVKMRDTYSTDKLNMELMNNEGFAMNQRRGTAHVFCSEALERFLKTNKLTHFIRAHEVIKFGYYVQQKGQLLTIFSSSRYCGGDNDAACVLVECGKLRILRLEHYDKM